MGKLCDFILSERRRDGRILTREVIYLDAVGNIDFDEVMWLDEPLLYCNSRG